jgi:hypothetical protein
VLLRKVRGASTLVRKGPLCSPKRVHPQAVARANTCSVRRWSRRARAREGLTKPPVSRLRSAHPAPGLGSAAGRARTGPSKNGGPVLVSRGGSILVSAEGERSSGARLTRMAGPGGGFSGALGLIHSQALSRSTAPAPWWLHGGAIVIHLRSEDPKMINAVVVAATQAAAAACRGAGGARGGAGGRLKTCGRLWKAGAPRRRAFTTGGSR